MKKITKLIKVVFILTLLVVTALVCWQIFGKFYLYQAGRSCGGDYFNALAYAKFFRENFTWPPLGWLPFWHEGVPEIGGYSWFGYLLLQPLHRYFSAEWATEIFSVAAIGLFFVSSYLLFGEITDDFLVAFGLVLVLIFTRAIYYPLLSGGFVISSAMQFLLPLTLFALVRFLKGKGERWLILSAFFAGLSLLWHAPIGLICIFAPSLAIFFFWPGSLKKKLGRLFLFSLLACLIGSMGLYTMANQVLFGQGKDRCQSIECWGAYPRHFWWFNSVAFYLLLGSLVLVAILKLRKREIEIGKIFALLVGLGIIVVYAFLAKLKMINSLVNTIFPTRTFWAAGLLILTVAAQAWEQIRTRLGKFKWLESIVAFTILGVMIFLWNQKEGVAMGRICDVGSVSPTNIEQWITEKYGKRNWQEKIPDWLPLEETNWRMDSLSHQFTHWFNFLAKMPSTRGYSNYPLGKHRDWLYWFQSVMMRNQGEIEKNMAKFLLDAFGVGFLQGTEYDPSLTTDKNIISRSEPKGGFFYYQLKKEVSSPIVVGSQAPVLLFIGDEEAYDSFTRSLAMSNLNSRRLIVVRDKTGLLGFDLEDLKQFAVIFLYGYQSKKINWQKLEDYVRQGGKVWLETGDFVSESASRQSGYGRLPTIFPIEETTVEVLGKDWYGELSLGETTEISLSSFSPLAEDGRDWNISVAKAVRNWAQPVLIQQGKVVVARGKLGRGEVIWSGFNLPYHLVFHQNAVEDKFLIFLLGELVDFSSEGLPEYQVLRVEPREVVISGKNLRGIFFKENFDSGWKAKTSQGKKLKIYKAGLDFMYVRLPDEGGEIQVEFVYYGSWLGWLLFSLTILTFFWMLAFMVIPEKLSQPFKNLSEGSKKKIKKSWEEE